MRILGVFLMGTIVKSADISTYGHFSEKIIPKIRLVLFGKNPNLYH